MIDLPLLIASKDTDQNIFSAFVDLSLTVAARLVSRACRQAVFGNSENALVRESG